jgi:hypothetical protein
MRGTSMYGLVLIKGYEVATIEAASLDVLCACAMSYALCGWHTYDVLGFVV